MANCIAAVVLSLIAIVNSQYPGTNTPEVHPKLTTQRCTRAKGCVKANTSIVLDSNFRWNHNKENTNCINKTFNSTICPDAETCAKNCALEGVEYSGYGLKTNGDSVSMNLFTKKAGVTNLASPRIYLFDEDNGRYSDFRLLNQEFAFDVDMAKTGCGVNGALYFSEMSLTGDKNQLNTAGAKYGTGYCDAQCPKQNFIHGKANLKGNLGACCSEMDIWEANNAATAFTPHPCNMTGVYACDGALCGTTNKLDSVCDKDGCEINSFRNGNRSFYGKGPQKTIDTTRPFTVVTQFITDTQTSSGVLTEIRRLYVQNGKVTSEARATAPGLDAANSMTDGYCSAQKRAFGGANSPNAFKNQGGMKQMGEALGRGMVLAMAIWHDGGGSMHWLDSTVPENAGPDVPGAMRGPCPTTGGRPEQIQAQQPDAAVVFSAIKVGEIGSTYKQQ